VGELEFGLTAPVDIRGTTVFRRCGQDDRIAGLAGLIGHKLAAVNGAALENRRYRIPRFFAILQM